MIDLMSVWILATLISPVVIMAAGSNLLERRNRKYGVQ
jgi:hypothetical protein